MKMLSTALSTVLAFGTFVVADVAPCRADGPPAAVSYATAPAVDPAATPQQGTEEEERAYARRESESPAAQGFSGGSLLSIILIAVVVIVIIILLQ